MINGGITLLTGSRRCKSLLYDGKRHDVEKPEAETECSAESPTVLYSAMKLFDFTNPSIFPSAAADCSSLHSEDCFGFFRASSESSDRFLGAWEGNRSSSPAFPRNKYTSNSDTAVSENINASPSKRPLKVANGFQPPANLTCVFVGVLKYTLRFTVHDVVVDADRRITDFRNLSPCLSTNHEGSACELKDEDGEDNQKRLNLTEAHRIPSRQQRWTKNQPYLPKIPAEAAYCNNNFINTLILS